MLEELKYMHLTALANILYGYKNDKLMITFSVHIER